MTPTELVAASAKAADDRAAATASTASAAAVVPQPTDQSTMAPPANGSQKNAQRVDTAIEKANKWMSDSASVVLDGGDDGAQASSEIVRFISEGSTIATQLILVRDEADTLGRIQEVVDLHEAVFQRSAGLGNELAGVEAST
jgi:hypothetical protein